MEKKKLSSITHDDIQKIVGERCAHIFNDCFIMWNGTTIYFDGAAKICGWDHRDIMLKIEKGGFIPDFYFD